MAIIDPRKMALQIAGVRMAESLLSEKERVFYDPYARFFFDDEVQEQFKTDEQAKKQIEAYNQMMPGVNGAIVSRIRFIDDCLKQCVEEGFKQAVVIGAGYDTRAYRIEGVKENMTVFEIDHPITQEVKTQTITQIFGSLPDHVIYVPIVFGKERLDQKLFESGYNVELKTIFIVEGLLMYIPSEAVDKLLTFISAASCPGSALVADYFTTAVIDGTSTLKEARVLKQFVEKEGSALMFGLEDQKEELFFTQKGFHRIKLLSATACKEKYFKGESALRSVSPMFNFVVAVVAPR